MLNHPCLPGIIISMVMIMKFYQHVHEFNVQELVWVILCLCLLENLMYSFLTCCALIWFWYQSDPGCVHWSSVPSFLLFCGILWGALVLILLSLPFSLPPYVCVCVYLCVYILCAGAHGSQKSVSDPLDFEF